MGFMEYLAKQAIKKEIKKGSKAVDNMIKTAKNKYSKMNKNLSIEDLVG